MLRDCFRAHEREHVLRERLDRDRLPLHVPLLEPRAHTLHDLCGPAVVAHHILDDGMQLLDIERLSLQKNLRSLAVLLDGAQRLADFVRERGRELAEERDATDVSELAAQLACFSLRAPLLRHVAHDATHQRRLAIRTELDRPLGRDPARGARGRHDTKEQRMLAATPERGQKRVAQLVRIGRVDGPQYICGNDVGRLIQTQDGPRLLGRPHAHARRIPGPQARPRTARRELEPLLALAQIAREARGPQHIAANLQRHRAQGDDERRDDQDRQQRDAPDHELRQDQREHHGDQDRAAEHQGPAPGFGGSSAPQRHDDIEHEQRQEKRRENGQPLVLAGDRTGHDRHRLAQERDLPDGVDALEVEIRLTEEIENENRGAQSDDGRQQPQAPRVQVQSQKDGHAADQQKQGKLHPPYELPPLLRSLCMQGLELDERARGQSERCNGECKIAAGAAVVYPDERVYDAEQQRGARRRGPDDRDVAHHTRRVLEHTD